MASEKTVVRTLQGCVTSNKADKTVTVLIERKIKHPKYGKFMKRSTKLHVHDENNQCNEGDIVIIRETKPYSKLKAWCLVEIVEAAVKI